VHGALCIAYSGRCLLSGYFQSPRSESGKLHQFLPLGLQGQHFGRRCASRFAGQPPQEQENSARGKECGPGELMPIEEDEHGTYIMNSKDFARH
jgi:putative protease